MTAAAIIRRVRDAGGAISLAEDRLKLSLPKSVADALTAEIRTHKDAIRRALKNASADSWDGDDYRTFYEERAAIAEHDGSLSREDAEAQALAGAITQWLFRQRKSRHNPQKPDSMAAMRPTPFPMNGRHKTIVASP